MSVTIDVQFAVDSRDVPDRKQINKWAMSCLDNMNDNSVFTVRIVDEAEMLILNNTWRGIHALTNVLSFPAGHNDIMPELLGDIVICAPVIAREAAEQAKPADAHWAHMIIHGILHLLGYDHIDDEDATVMELLEIQKLESLGF
ncbi:MAG: rRNA maturation RNase YbeY, partial [Gammaproteobacteria bacterium]